MGKDRKGRMGIGRVRMGGMDREMMGRSRVERREMMGRIEGR